MARNVVHLKSNDSAGDGGGLATGKVRVISDKDFQALIKKCRTAQAGMDSERATLGSHISDACENRNLHKGAFGIYRRLDKMDDVKRAELLFHFDIYRERAKWNETDMFPDRDHGDEAAE
jgi:hypothetical protein